MKLIEKIIVLGGVISLPFFGCENEVVKYVYEYPLDILGNVEYERYGDFTKDDYNDGDIDVVLSFESNEYGFEPGDIVAYYKTVDNDPINYWFKFIPKGWYGIEASLRDGDAFVSEKSNDFYHYDDIDTYVDLYLQLPGTMAKTSKQSQDLGKVLDTETLYVSNSMYELMKENIVNNNPEKLEEFEQSVEVLDDIQSLKNYMLADIDRMR